MKRRQLLKTGTLAALVATTGCSQPPNPKSAVVRLGSGQVQGEIVNGVHRYLGIPYAEPPFGVNRFSAPVRRGDWNGIFPATSYGAICPQTGGMKDSLPAEGEDCLNLNVWTPEPGAGALPVMVWLHGGGQVTGAGSDVRYDGSRFADEGVVLVTCNRRLGAEGFLYLENLMGDGVGTGDLGIQDVVAVLEWVQENITGFGGDPGNVTLFGESGGGAAAQAVVAMPRSSGLVHKAILQSGGFSVQRPTTASQVAEVVLSKIGVRKGDLEKLQGVHWQKLLDAYPEIEGLPQARPQTYLPVVGEAMPHHPVDANFEGRGLDIGYMVGTCRDEANLFTLLMGSLEGSMFHDRALHVFKNSEVDWDRAMALYRHLEPDFDDEEIFERLVIDAWFRLPALKIAEGLRRHSDRNNYHFVFDWESPLLGATHGLDLIVFGNGMPLPGAGGFRDFESTATFMRKRWVSFATTGDPGGGWLPYGDSRMVMSLDDNPELLRHPFVKESELFHQAIEQNWWQAGL